MSSVCKQLEGYDLVVVIGAPVFRYYPYAPGQPLPDGTRLIHLTDNPEETARAVVGDSVLCDPGRACATLAALVPATTRPAPAPIPAMPEPVVGDRITPDYLYYMIEKTRPADSVITQESLSTLDLLHKRIRTTAPRSFFSMFSGVLGYGLPATVGVALAERDLGTNRKVICIVGDGAAQYVIQTFWSAAQQQVPVLVVVVRNGAYDILKSFSDYLVAPKVPGFDLPHIDCVLLAKGYGCDGERVTDPAGLEEALRRGLRASQPYVLEVQVEEKVPALLGKVGPKTQFQNPDGSPARA